MLMITVDDVDDDVSSLYHYEETGSHTRNSGLHKKQDLVYLLDSVANLSYNTWYIYIYIFYVNKVYIYIYRYLQKNTEGERGRTKKGTCKEGIFTYNQQQTRVGLLSQLTTA